MTSGLCLCGCGATVRLAPRTDARKGWVKGQPMRYVAGHQRRGTTKIGPYGPYEVDPETGCWNWLRHIDCHGYGRRWYKGKPGQLAHRAAYEMTRGPIPAGKALDHLCRNRRCINPSHLEPVTNRENLRRGIRTRLSTEAAVVIRASAPGELEALARQFGVSVGYARNLRCPSSAHLWTEVA